MKDKDGPIRGYQDGNLRSVPKALERFGAGAVITSDPDEVSRADAMVLPGQGAQSSGWCPQGEEVGTAYRRLELSPQRSDTSQRSGKECRPYRG